MKKDRELTAYIVILVFCFTIGLAWWVIGSKFEANAYNNITGKNVSTWDAMWIQLRVQEGAK